MAARSVGRGVAAWNLHSQHTPQMSKRVPSLLIHMWGRVRRTTNGASTSNYPIVGFWCVTANCVRWRARKPIRRSPIIVAAAHPVFMESVTSYFIGRRMRNGNETSQFICELDGVTLVTAAEDNELYVGGGLWVVLCERAMEEIRMRK